MVFLFGGDVLEEVGGSLGCFWVFKFSFGIEEIEGFEVEGEEGPG